MTERVGIDFGTNGEEQLASAFDRLRQSVEAVSRGMAQSTQVQERAARAADSARDSVDRQREALTRQTQVIQQGAARMAAAAGAVASLSAAFGSQNESATLVARTMTSVASFAMLGSVLGPGGTVIGGFAGLLIALGQASEAHEHAAESAHHQREALVALARQAIATRTEQEQQARIRRGDLAGVDVELEIEVRRQRLTQLQTERLAEGDRFRREVIIGFRVDYEAHQQALDQLRRDEARAREELATLESGRAMAGLSGMQGGGRAFDFEAPDAITPRARAPRVRGGGGRRAHEAGDAEERSLTAFLREQDREGRAMHEEELRRLDETKQAEQRLIDQRREASDEEKRHNQIVFEARKRQLIELARVEAEKHDARVRQAEDQLGVVTDYGKQVGGVFAGAYASAISGQESFDVALAKGAKQQLVQLGTGFIAEGIGALLTAVGSTVLNPPAAATKALEGAGKVALGASLGAVGVAIPVPSAGAGAAPKERPDGRQAQGGSGSVSSVVVNMNAPSAIGGTQEDFGRLAARSITRAQKRFGRAA